MPGRADDAGPDEPRGRVLYFDPAAIASEMLRRRPDIDPGRAVCYIPTSNAGGFAVLQHSTGVPDGVEVESELEAVEKYHGLAVDIIRWRAKKR